MMRVNDVDAGAGAARTGALDTTVTRVAITNGVMNWT